jgi:ketosteroid isomerase-like protein
LRKYSENEGGVEMSTSQIGEVVDQYHRAASEFINGNPEPYKALFSQRDDATLGNPFGPIGRGWEQIAGIMERASALYSDGEGPDFENITTYVTPDLAFIVEIERFRTKIAGREELSSVALRTTSIFRPEDNGWKIVHRHADPITSARPPESVLQQ